MHSAIEWMLKKYHCHNVTDYCNALKEIIQEITLLGLWRSKFFEKSAFYGGTALRILYGLDRFSEDIDFSLLKPDLNFKMEKYNEAVHAELQAFGFQTEITTREKTIDSNIQSAFIKADTKIQLLSILAPTEITRSLHGKQRIKIKMEIDINPPQEFQTEVKTLLQPIPFSVNTYQMPDLFAGKIHALLCRSWKSLVKGRDWYDFIWYIGRKIPIRSAHLQARLVQSGHWPHEKPLELQDIMHLICEKIQTLNIEQAKKDVVLFLRDPASIESWSQEFFLALVQRITVLDK
jgi:predicted nucleotidyltransferase component of viral defense system